MSYSKNPRQGGELGAQLTAGEGRAAWSSKGVGAFSSIVAGERRAGRWRLKCMGTSGVRGLLHQHGKGAKPSRVGALEVPSTPPGRTKPRAFQVQWSFLLHPPGADPPLVPGGRPQVLPLSVLPSLPPQRMRSPLMRRPGVVWELAALRGGLAHLCPASRPPSHRGPGHHRGCHLDRSQHPPRWPWLSSDPATLHQ